MRLGDGLQHLPACSAVRKIIVPEWAIGDHGDAMLLAPWDHRVLDRALAQMVEHLIAGDLAGSPAIGQHLVEIVDIEIADAP